MKLRRLRTKVFSVVFIASARVGNGLSMPKRFRKSLICPGPSKARAIRMRSVAMDCGLCRSARARRAGGDLAGAQRQTERALQIFRKAYGPDNPRTIFLQEADFVPLVVQRRRY
jgi:hypothetical protein